MRNKEKGYLRNASGVASLVEEPMANRRNAWSVDETASNAIEDTINHDEVPVF